MMKPKAALIKDGTIPTKMGKGRLSGEQIARCKELAAMGWDIEGYTVTKSTAADATPVVEKAERHDPNRVFDIPDESRPESVWRAYRHDDGKQVTVGMRTVCNACGTSLTYCRCEHPRVWVDHNAEAVVYFKPVRKP